MATTTTTGPAVQYCKGGNPISPSQNKLSSMAYWYTKDIDDGKPRIDTRRFVELLHALGVKDPKVAPWEVTLPNGVILSAIAGTPEAIAAAKAKAGTNAPKATKPRGRAARVDVMKKAGDNLKAAGRYSGPDKIEITKENAAALAGASVEEIKVMVVEAPAPPAFPSDPVAKTAPLARKTVTPRPKKGKTTDTPAAKQIARRVSAQKGAATRASQRNAKVRNAEDEAKAS